MIAWGFLNYMFSPLTDIVVFGASLVCATAAGITAFLLISSGNIKTFKRNLFSKRRAAGLPIVSPDGSLVDTKEELEAHLEVLESKLLEKVGEIATSKTKINDAKESMGKLSSTQVQVKKYYIKLREEMNKSEEDCKRLQSQIDDFREKRNELEREMQKNEIYYRHLLGIAKNDDSCESSQISSISSLSSGDSGSYYDSSPNANEEHSVDTEDGDIKLTCRTKTRVKTTAVTKPEFTDSESKSPTLTDDMTKGDSGLTINPLSSDNLKKSSSLSSFAASTTEESVKKSKECTKLRNSDGSNKPSNASLQGPNSVKDQLVVTGKMYFGKTNYQKQTKLEDYRIKKNSNSKTSNK